MIPSDRDQETENHLRLYQILVLHICIRIFKSTAPYLGFVRRCPALRLVRSLKNKFRKACKATTTANSMHSWRRTQCVKLCGTYRTPIFSGGINKPLAFFLWSYVKAKSFSNEIKKCKSIAKQNTEVRGSTFSIIRVDVQRNGDWFSCSFPFFEQVFFGRHFMMLQSLKPLRIFTLSLEKKKNVDFEFAELAHQSIHIYQLTSQPVSPSRLVLPD